MAVDTSKEETLRAYNSNPEYYASRFDKYSFYFDGCVERFLSKLHPKSKVVDMGSGAGTYGTQIRAAGHDVLCIDNSEEMARISRSRGLTTLVMDMEELRLPEKDYDAVWAMTSIVHIEKSRIENVLGRAYNILKDDGLLFVCVQEGKDDGLKEERNFPGLYRHSSTFQKGELDIRLSRLFKVEETWIVNGDLGVVFLNYLARKV